MADTTTGGDLNSKAGSRKVGVLTRLGNMLSGGQRKPTDGPIRDPEGLRVLLRRDRLRRKMTWAAYATFLDVNLSTLYKIACGVHKATELTETTIRERLDANP